MIYIFRTKASTGARELATALDGRRIRQIENLNRMVRPGDTVICWGEHLVREGVNVLNGGPFRTKFEDAVRLTEANISTIQVSRIRPMPQAVNPPVDPALREWADAQGLAEEFTQIQFNRDQPTQDGIRHLIEQLIGLGTALIADPPVAPPPVEVGEWIGRSNHHVGGADLLNENGQDYFVKKESIIEEYRIHCFKGKSIRAGKKVHRGNGTTPHAWIRSLEAGWKISYDGFKSTEEMRNLAASAIEALGLDFGAVDVGLTADHSLMVLEVNRAPGLENNTIEAYAKAIENWEEHFEEAA